MIITNELITDCKKNDRVAQKQLYLLLAPYLNMICKRYLSDQTHSEDILQEAFMSIFSNLEKYDPSRSQFQTWAVRITINCCLKSNQKNIKTNNHQPITDQHNRPSTPEILAKLSNEDLLKFLKRMPEKYFEVFNLHIIDGFSHKEIAKLIGVNETLSRKRLSRAKEWLSSEKQKTILKAFS